MGPKGRADGGGQIATLLAALQPSQSGAQLNLLASPLLQLWASQAVPETRAFFSLWTNSSCCLNPHPWGVRKEERGKAWYLNLEMEAEPYWAHTACLSYVLIFPPPIVYFNNKTQLVGPLSRIHAPPPTTHTYTPLEERQNSSVCVVNRLGFWRKIQIPLWHLLAVSPLANPGLCSWFLSSGE